MNKFLVVKVLDYQSIALPTTLVYGDVELRSHESDAENEIEVLKKSAMLNKFDFDKYIYCARIATIVDANKTNDALDIAESIFSEVLDLKSVEFALSNLKTSDVGFIKNLDSGEISPIAMNELSSAMAFMMHQGDIQRIDSINYILSLKNELSIRYQRSLHWMRNSKHEKNKQLKTLFYWFAIEALIKESETDHVGPVIRWFLGFPNGRDRNVLPVHIIDKLSSHNKYEYWSKEIIDIIEKIRKFRNDSVHSGFRKIDFKKDELELYTKVMVFSTSRCHSAVKYALINGVSTVAEFKEYIGVIFEGVCDINDIHGNVIYSLENS